MSGSQLRQRHCGGRALAQAVLVVAGLLSQGTSAGEVPGVAALTISSPGSLAEVVPAFFASFSAPETPPVEVVAWTPADDPMGCRSYLLPNQLPGSRAGVAVVRHGNCTFPRKAQLAVRAGAQGIVVVSDSDQVQIMGAGNTSEASVDITTVGVSKSVGDKILAWNSANPEQPVVMSFEVYEPSALNPSSLLLAVLATSLVAAGACFSTSDLSTRGSFQRAVAAPQKRFREVNYQLTIGYVVFGSCFLVVSYFFIHYMVYYLRWCFCFGGFIALQQIGGIFLQWACPALSKEALAVPRVGPLAQDAAPIRSACMGEPRRRDAEWLCFGCVGGIGADLSQWPGRRAGDGRACGRCDRPDPSVLLARRPLAPMEVSDAPMAEGSGGPELRHRFGCTQAGLLAGVPATAVVISWFILRNSSGGWFFQDVIGAGCLCWAQRALRLPNLRIATLFLCIMMFYDIFWVFISPMFFHGHSVMVTVATGGDTHEAVPMLLRMPAIGDPLGNDMLLGFGDIALPGLLVSFLWRHDVSSHRTLLSCNGYFGPSLIGYFCGLCAAGIASEIMHMGQPALLYLVPVTLGTTVVRALWKGELMSLWDGRAARPSGSERWAAPASSPLAVPLVPLAAAPVAALQP